MGRGEGICQAAQLAGPSHGRPAENDLRFVDDTIPKACRNNNRNCRPSHLTKVTYLALQQNTQTDGDGHGSHATAREWQPTVSPTALQRSTPTEMKRAYHITPSSASCASSVFLWAAGPARLRTLTPHLNLLLRQGSQLPLLAAGGCPLVQHDANSQAGSSLTSH